MGWVGWVGWVDGCLSELGWGVCVAATAFWVVSEEATGQKRMS